MPSTLSPKTLLGGLAAGYVVCFALMAVELDKLFGLPAHPLLVHPPVILVPALVVMSIAMLARPDWRRRYGIVWAILGLCALGSTVLAAGAGDKFLEAQRENTSLIHEHQEAGEQLRLLLFVFVPFIGFMLWRDLTGSRFGGRQLAAAAMVAGIALSGATGFMVARAGHLGAKSVWQERGEGGGGEGFDGDAG